MQYIANARSWTGFRKIDPHSPTAEAVGLNPKQCGFESRCGYALVAQMAEAAASKPLQCRFESCSAHQSDWRVPGAAQHEAIRAFTPVFAGYAEWCAADPGPLRTVAVPDQRCTTRASALALHRIRDTTLQFHLLSLAAQSSAPTSRDPGFESLRRYASLAQLVRASARHAEGPRFKSVRTHQFLP
jgi:hypothetical protein